MLRMTGLDCTGMRRNKLGRPERSIPNANGLVGHQQSAAEAKLTRLLRGCLKSFMLVQGDSA